MEQEIYLLVILFAITAVAYICAINSRGVVRIVLSYILATALLIGAIFTTLKFQNNKELARKETERAKYEEQLKKAEEEARLAAEQKASPDVTADKQYKAALAKIISDGSNLAKAILSVNVDDENADADKLMNRAGGLKGQAGELKKQLDGLQKSATDPNCVAARDLVEKAVRSLTVGANYLNLYFKAENTSEEDERYDIFRQNASAARSDFSKASDKLEGK
jgi:hypothetical protein